MESFNIHFSQNLGDFHREMPEVEMFNIYIFRRTSVISIEKCLKLKCSQLVNIPNSLNEGTNHDLDVYENMSKTQPEQQSKLFQYWIRIKLRILNYKAWDCLIANFVMRGHIVKITSYWHLTRQLVRICRVNWEKQD